MIRQTILKSSAFRRFAIQSAVRGHHQQSDPKSFFDLCKVSSTHAHLQTDNAVSGYEATLSTRLSVGGAPNGGYLAAIAIEAAQHALTHSSSNASASSTTPSPAPTASYPHPLALSCFYLNKALEGQTAQLQVEVVNASKSTATVSVKLVQEKIPRCSFTIMFGDLKRMKGLTKVLPEISLPLPAVDECIDASAVLVPLLGKKHVTVMNEIDIRVPSDCPFNLSTLERTRKGNPFAASPVAEEASQKGYVRLHKNESVETKPMDMRSVAFLCDALPPPVLNISPSPWVPTLEYTVHFFDVPEKTDEWLRFEFRSPYVRQGLLFTDGCLFSQDGSTLLARSRQLARHLPPPSAPTSPQK